MVDFKCFLVLLITGGATEEDHGAGAHFSTEVYDPSGRTCLVSDLIIPRATHAMAGRTVCGAHLTADAGGDPCETLGDNGEWTLSHQLRENRTSLGMWANKLKVGNEIIKVRLIINQV